MLALPTARNMAKVFTRRRLLVLTGVICVPLLTFALYFALKTPTQDSTIPQPTSITHNQDTTTQVGLPVRLKIPKIDIEAAIDHVGMTPQGEMDIPKDPARTAWFNLGPRPGEKGSSVIDGHFGWKNDLPAVFDNLHTLQKGDKLYVEDEKGATTTFIVRELRTYSPDEDASAVFSSSDGKEHMNLITCQGAWNKDQKSYSKRLVVFSDKATNTKAQQISPQNKKWN